MSIIGLLNPVADSWTSKAACIGFPELFFIEKGESERRAKLICQSCPVRSECLMEALAKNEQDGIWGQKNLDERRAIRRGAPIKWDRVKCNHSHDLGRVGITAKGSCRQCVKDRMARDWQRRKAAKA